MALFNVRQTGRALLLLPALSCAATSPQTVDPKTGFVIEHVNVLPMTANGAILHDVSVVVRDGMITAVDAAQTVRVPSGMHHISGEAKWLMPGLADMHVHVVNRGLARIRHQDIAPEQMLTQDVMLPFIANGVTQILDMSSLPESLEQRDEIARGAALGPHYATTGEIDGSPAVWGPVAREAVTPEEARRAVHDIHAAGYDFIKVYSRLSLPAYAAILDEARREGIRVIGHLPDAARGDAESVLVDGLAMVAHAEEYAKQATNLADPTVSDHDVERFAALAKRHGIWLTGTLTTMQWISRQTEDSAVIAANPYLKYMYPAVVAQWLHNNQYVQRASPQRVMLFARMVAFNDRLVRTFAGDGIPILAGTDASVPGIVYGYSLHDELEALAHAGLSNRQVLESATRVPAEFLGVQVKRGTVETGKEADLLLLDADPLADVANTRRIAAVVIAGSFYSRQRLDAMMDDLARRYATMKVPEPIGNGGEDD
jgi:imidazolonepropionase-like amidohydrolase